MHANIKYIFFVFSNESNRAMQFHSFCFSLALSLFFLVFCIEIYSVQCNAMSNDRMGNRMASKQQRGQQARGTYRTESIGLDSVAETIAVFAAVSNGRCRIGRNDDDKRQRSDKGARMIRRSVDVIDGQIK